MASDRPWAMDPTVNGGSQGQESTVLHQVSLILSSFASMILWTESVTKPGEVM